MKQIQLTKGKIALVDDADFERVNQFKWHAVRDLNNGRWYARRKIRVKGKKSVLAMARFIRGLEHGDPRQVDHKDRVNTLDNRRQNLRIANHAQNARNIGIPKTNTSGYKGVTSKRDKWQVQLRAQDKTLYGGLFDDALSGAAFYNWMALKFHGEFAVLNDLSHCGTVPTPTRSDGQSA